MEFNADLQALRSHAKPSWLKHLWLTLGLGLSLSIAGLVADCPPLDQVTLHNGAEQRGADSRSLIMNGLALEKEMGAATEDCLQFKLGTIATPSLTSELIRCLPRLISWDDSAVEVAVVEKSPGVVFRASLHKPGDGCGPSFAAAMTETFPNIRQIVISNRPLAQDDKSPPGIPQHPFLAISRIKIIFHDNQELEYDILTEKPLSLAPEMKVVEVKPHRPGATAAAVVAGERPLWASRGFSHYREVREMEATAYYPGPECTGKYAAFGLTYTGKKAGFGIVAVDPAVIPLGTKLYIVGYGFAAAEDIGGLIKGNIIDLCFETYQEAVNYGRQRVKVYILK